MTTKTLKLIPAACVALALSGCGAAGGGGSNAAAATLDYIRAHGFPRLADLMPSLPAQLARIPGVDTSATGLPALPSDLGGASFDNMDALLGEAQTLAAQGFSESRRLEASVLSLANPIHNVLGQSNLFQAAGLDSDSSVGSTGSGAFLADSPPSGGGVNLFDQLLNASQFAVATNGEGGMPSYLMLGIDAASESVDISGLWPENAAFHTGFNARVRLNAADDFALTLTLAPARIAGLVSDWTKTSCADDVWQVTVGASPTTGRSLEFATQECPSDRNAVSTVKFAQDSAGTWQFAGGFAQTFADLDAKTLRGFLGARQGFVVQAAAADDLSKLAAAAAVLGESDFAAPSQANIDQFGVGQLIAHYFQAKYFEPKRSAAASDDITSNYDNTAYWMCDAPGVSSTVKGQAAAAKDLCAGRSADVEPALAAMTSLKNGLDDAIFAPSTLKTTVSRLVSILSIRNTLFVGTDGALAYKKAPDQTFSTLDDSRKAITPSALGATDWVADAASKMKTLKAAEIPDTPYKAVAGGLSKFLKGECESLVGDAATKAGKSTNAATGACGG